MRWVGVGDGVYWVEAGWCSEVEVVVVGAEKHVAVVWASAAVVYAEWVRYWDFSAGGSAWGGVGLCYGCEECCECYEWESEGFGCSHST